MGIIRLAKCLKLLDSLIEYKNRKDDIDNKIHSNRIYMDFVSIVYKMQMEIANELNYLLFSFILAKQKLLNETELNSEKLKQMLEKYKDILHHFDDINNIDDDFINLFLSTNVEYINEYVYKNVIKFIADLISNKLINVEYILIAFDGIPNFGKIQEQRQRRYMRYAQSEFQNKIMNNIVESTNKLINARLFYDTCYFKIDVKNAIDYVYNKYHDSKLQQDLSDLLTHNITIDVINRTYGEGEKILIDKLIDDIHYFKNTKSYSFYSPDGDSVILCLQAYIKTNANMMFLLNNLHVIKSYNINPTNNNNETSQYVDISQLFNNIIQKIQQMQPKLLELTQQEKNLICYDFIFLMNMFGNDFIHAIPTLEISSTIIDLLYVYSLFIENRSYLTFYNKYKINMNYENIRKFLIHLATYEKSIILDTYLSDVDNKHILKKHFGNLFTFDHIIDYKIKIEQIKNIFFENYDNIENFEQYINKNIDQLNNLSEKKYGDIWKKIEIKNINNYIEKIKINKNYLLEQQPKFLYNIHPKRKKNEKEIQLLINKIEYELLENNISIDMNKIHSSDDKNISSFSFEYSNIRNMLPHNQMPTTIKDIDLFLLDFRGGKWMHMLNGYSYEIGYDSKTQTIKSFDREMKRYQYDMLRLNKSQMTKFIIDYLKTLSWVTDYYLNTNDASTTSVISTWSFNYNRSPFISSIASYVSSINENELKKIMHNFYAKNTISVTKYLSKEIHSYYIYPHKNQSDTNEYFPNIKQYVIDTYDNHDNNKKVTYFDCRLCPYFSKCIFENKQLSFNKLKDIKVDCLNHQ